MEFGGVVGRVVFGWPCGCCCRVVRFRGAVCGCGCCCGCVGRKLIAAVEVGVGLRWRLDRSLWVRRLCGAAPVEMCGLFGDQPSRRRVLVWPNRLRVGGRSGFGMCVGGRFGCGVLVPGASVEFSSKLFGSEPCPLFEEERCVGRDGVVSQVAHPLCFDGSSSGP